MLDNSRLYKPHAEVASRSMMNVTFRTGDEALDKEFCAGAAKRGLLNVKGHRLTGGMRVSLYKRDDAGRREGHSRIYEDFEVEHHV